MLLKDFLLQTEISQSKMAGAIGVQRRSVRDYIDSGATVVIDWKDECGRVVTASGREKHFLLSSLPGPHRVI